MVKIKKNKTQNLLSISLVLCLIGCVHAMDAEDASPELLMLSGRRVNWNELCIGLPGPDLPHPGAGNLVYANNLWEFIPRGTTEKRTICTGILPDDREQLDEFFRDFAEKNNDGPNGFDAFRNAVGRGNVTLEGLRRAFPDPGRIAFFAVHAEVFENILGTLDAEDLYILLKEIATFLRWDGFAKVQDRFNVFSTLFRREHHNVVYKIVNDMPIQQLLEMNWFQWVLEDLLQSDQAQHVADLISEKVYAGHLLQMEVGRLAMYLSHSGHVGVIAGLIGRAIVEKLLETREAYRVFNNLIEGGHGDVVTRQIRKMGIERLRDMYGAWSVLCTLVGKSRDQDQFVKRIIGEMSPDDLSWMDGALSVLTTLTRNGYVDFAIEQLARLTKKQLLRMDDVIGLFEELVKKGRDEFVVEQLGNMSRQELAGIGSPSSLLIVLIEAGQGQFATELIRDKINFKVFLRGPRACRVLQMLVKNGLTDVVKHLMKQRPNEFLEAEEASIVLTELAKNGEFEFAQGLIHAKPAPNLLRMDGICDLLVALVENGQSWWLNRWLIDEEYNPLALLSLMDAGPGVHLRGACAACRVLKALVKNGNASFVVYRIQRTAKYFLNMNGIHEVLVALVENSAEDGHDWFVRNLIADDDNKLVLPSPDADPSEDLQGVGKDFAVLKALVKNGHAPFVAGVVQSNFRGLQYVKGIHELLVALAENGQEECVASLVKGIFEDKGDRMRLKAFLKADRAWGVLEVLRQKGHPEFIEDLMDKNPEEFLQIPISSTALAALVKDVRWRFALDQHKEQLLQVYDYNVYEILVALAESNQGQLAINLINETRGTDNDLVNNKAIYETLIALVENNYAKFVVRLIKNEPERLLGMSRSYKLSRTLAANGHDRLIVDLIEKGRVGFDSAVLGTLVEKGHVDFVADRIRAMSKWQLRGMRGLYRVLDALADKRKGDLVDATRRRIEVPKLT